MAEKTYLIKNEDEDYVCLDAQGHSYRPAIGTPEDIIAYSFNQSTNVLTARLINPSDRIQNLINNGRCFLAISVRKTVSNQHHSKYYKPLSQVRSWQYHPCATWKWELNSIQITNSNKNNIVLNVNFPSNQAYTCVGKLDYILYGNYEAWNMGEDDLRETYWIDFRPILLDFPSLELHVDTARAIKTISKWTRIEFDNDYDY